MFRTNLYDRILLSPDAPSGAGSAASSSASGTGGGASATPAPASAPSTPSAPSAPTSTSSSTSGSGADATAGSPRDVDSAFSFPDESIEDLDNHFQETPAKPTAQSTEIPATPTDPAQPQTPPADQQQPQPPQPQAPTTQTQTTPTADLSDPMQLAEAFQNNLPQVIEQLTADFALTDAEKQALEEDAVGAMPRLAATVHARTLIATSKMIATLVPQMFEKQMKLMRARDEGENAFYDMWKDKGITREHAPIVRRLGTLYRRENPTATREQMFKDLGAMVITAAGITAPAPTTAAPTGVRPNGALPPSPFVPVQSGPVATQQSSGDPWTGLHQEYDEG